jgi:Cu2+-exporting ATPase
MNAANISIPSSEELRLVSKTLSETLQSTELSLPDMHCGACIGRIENALIKLDGVHKVRANLTNKSVSINWSNDMDPQQFVQRLHELGFHPILSAEQQQHSDLQLNAYIRALAVSGFAAGNVMLLSVSVWAGADQTTKLWFHWLSALITIPAVIYAGRFFFRSAFHAVRSGKTNMDVPISVGIVLACSLSVYDTVMHADRVYFEAAITLVFFLLIGRTVDHLVREKASKAISGLQALEPAGAYRIKPDGSKSFVRVNALVPGDVILVDVGSRIPADGTVLSGVSDINSELVDGESVPKTVSPNQSVLSGTLNLSAPLEITVTASAADSFLASIQQLVRYGEGSKGPYRKIADKVSSLYTPFVHGAALLAFLGWYFVSGDLHRSLSVAISVLIITCPCALALAVPMVQAIASQRLFAVGVVMKNGAALEKANLIKTIVFDKTGTITDGLPVVSATSEYSDSMLMLAQQLTQHSEHPYAKAIQTLQVSDPDLVAADNLRAVNHIKDVPGMGIEATTDQGVVRLGKRSWALGHTFALPHTDIEQSESVLTMNADIVAEFKFEHRFRAQAKQAVDRCQDQGFELVLLSGDTHATVRSTAAQLSIANWFAQCMPEQKLQKVLSYAEQGKGVLMVGDGLNDAGAMAAATASVAPANAAGVSRTVADFVFLRPSLMAVPDVLSVANQAHSLIKQNFSIALLYNAVALPIAFAGLVTPLVAAIAMSTSSVLVVANAMRVQSPKPVLNTRQSMQALEVTA